MLKVHIQMYLIQRQMYLRVYYGLLMSIIIQMSRFSPSLRQPSHTNTTQYMALEGKIQIQIQIQIQTQTQIQMSRHEINAQNEIILQ